MARDPMGMGRWTSRPMAWNPNPIPSPILPVPGSPDGIWIGGCSIIFHPGFRWSNSDHWGRTSQEKDNNGTEGDQRPYHSDFFVHRNSSFRLYIFYMILDGDARKKFKYFRDTLKKKKRLAFF
jgi:hypothetical protein